MIQRSHKLRAVLAQSATNILSATLLLKQKLELGGHKSLILTLDVTAADSGGTYDVYVCLGVPVAENPGGSVTAPTKVVEWDIVHFPQIAGATAKQYVARVLVDRLATVTTAGPPGVASEPPATFEVDTSGSAQGIKTLGAGSVNHGPFGDFISVYLVAAGTITTGITCSVSLTAG